MPNLSESAAWSVVAWSTVFSASVVAGALARGETMSLAPSQDATIIQWSADVPEPNPLLANGQGDIFVGRTNQDGQEAAAISIRRGLVQFDLAGAVPAGMRVVGATFTMRDVRGRNGDPTVTLHRVLSPWSEGNSFFDGGIGAPAQQGDVTWLHASYNATTPSASALWNTPGGDFTTIASAAAVVTDDLGDGQFFSWSGPGLVTDVLSWLAAPDQNFGWLIHGDESRGQSAKRFNSGESTTSPNVPPRLELELAPLLAGDYNDDGAVDAADYTFWRDRLGGSGPLANETVTPGAVTEEDYTVWRAQFGTVDAGSTSASTVPEPAAVWLATSVIAGLWAASRIQNLIGFKTGQFLREQQQEQH